MSGDELADRFINPRRRTPVIYKLWGVLQEARREINDDDLFFRILAAAMANMLRGREITNSAKLPRWFLQKSLKEKLLITQHPWGDHPFIDESQKALVFHPYELSMEQLKDFISICEGTHVRFYIDGRSHWFPGRTVRIVVVGGER